MSKKNDVILETNIDKVVVFLDGARVFRSGKVELKKGFRQVRVVGLTKNLLQDSVRVSGKGKGSLGAIDVETRYLEEVTHAALKALLLQEQKLKKELAKLQEQFEFTNHQKEQLQLLGDRFVSEFPLWFASGEAKLSTLSEFIEFESKRCSENIAYRQKLQDEIEKVNKKINVVRAEINDYRNKSKVEQTTDVVIGIDVDTTGPFIFEISYQAVGVNWQPTYDIDLGAEKAMVRGLAQVSNRTLEDWTNVALEISTAVFKPIRVVDPEPFYINVYDSYSLPRPKRGKGAPGLAAKMERATTSAALADAEKDLMKEVEEEKPIDDVAVPEAEIKESPAGVQSFEIPGKWTIPSDGDPHPVTLVKHELSTKKQFYWGASDPLGVIAQDKISNGDTVLLAGKAKVYSEGEFIGETFIDQIAPGEDFELGAREELKMKAKKKLLYRVKEKAGIVKGKRAIEYKYELSIKNFRKEESEITIKDVIPYSQSERIKVKWLECNLDLKDAKLGIYEWTMKIKPNAEEKIVYRYEVEWEKDYTIVPALP